MRVLHIYTENGKNLLERTVQNLVKGLDFNGVESQVCCLDASSDFSSILKASKASVIHLHSGATFKQCLLPAKLSGRKIIVTAHQANQSIPYSNQHWLYKKVASSDFVNEEVFSSKAEVIYDGIDLEDFDAQARTVDGDTLRQTYGIDKNVFIIGAIGPLILENDYESLFKALRNAVAKEMNAIVLISGEGPLRADLLKSAEALNIADRVKIINATDYVSLFCLFDAYVVSSFTEGYLSSILGAMAASKPVIATKIGANPEMVVQGKTGFLVPCGFPERIDNVIMRWRANPQLAKDIGSAGRQHVEEKFSLPVMGKKYKEFYGKL